MLAPLQLLHRELRHWLPMVVVLSMLSVVPETLLATVVPDPLAMVSGGADLDPEVMLSALAAFLGVAAAKMLVQLVTLMIAFVVLADLTAGRAPNVWAGLARLGSWRLQGAWIVAGMFEQIAISLWFLGGGAVLIPLGLVTTAAYEEASGFAAFTRSNELGRLHVSSGTFGPAGTRLAVGVTLAFALWFLCDSLIGLASCAGSIFSMSSATNCSVSAAVDTSSSPCERALPSSRRPSSAAKTPTRCSFPPARCRSSSACRSCRSRRRSPGSGPWGWSPCRPAG